MKAECYKLYRDDLLENNLKSETEYGYIFDFLDFDIKIDKILIDNSNELYVHIFKDKNHKIINIIIEPQKRWEFDLVETKEEIMKEKSMLEGHKITDVIFREIDPIALESALEKIELGEDVQLKTKGEDTYLVSSGKSLKITGEDFQNYMKKFLIGKYIDDINNPSTKKRRIMKELITKLGIIKGYITEVENEGLDAFFG